MLVEDMDEWENHIKTSTNTGSKVTWNPTVKKSDFFFQNFKDKNFISKH